MHNNVCYIQMESYRAAAVHPVKLINTFNLRTRCTLAILYKLIIVCSLLVSSFNQFGFKCESYTVMFVKQLFLEKYCKFLWPKMALYGVTVKNARS